MAISQAQKKKLQIYGLAAIGGVAAVYAMIAFVVLPLAQKRTKALAGIEGKEKDISGAREKIASTGGAEEEIERVKAQLREIDDKYILKPVFDNYLLRAQERIEKIAADAGLTVKISGVGQSQFSSGKSKSRPVLSAFLLQISAAATYDELREMMLRLEQENPYMIISGLKISAQKENRDRHQVQFRLHWPIWEDARITKRFEAKKEEKETDKTGPS